MTTVPIEIVVEEQLRAEIAEARKKLDAIDTMAFDLQPKVTKLLAKAAKSGKPEDARQAEQENNKLLSLIHQGVTMSERIRVLARPGELERRVHQKEQTNERIKNMTENTATPKKPTAKDQGFPAAYLGDNGNFKPGLDARAKSDLIGAVLGVEVKGKLHTFTADEAQKLIDARGWQPFLARKREILADQERKATEKAEEKKKAAEAKAEEKKKTADAKTAAAPSSGNEVKPDPKPAPKSKSK